MTPCPCARAWLSEMVEEALRRKPADADASWVVDWLLKRATDLTIARQEAVMLELRKQDEKAALRRLAVALKREWGQWNQLAYARRIPPQDRQNYREKMNQVGERLRRVEAELDGGTPEKRKRRRC